VLQLQTGPLRASSLTAMVRGDCHPRSSIDPDNPSGKEESSADDLGEAVMMHSNDGVDRPARNGSATRS
jgi:hypothetical protein